MEDREQEILQDNDDRKKRRFNLITSKHEVVTSILLVLCGILITLTVFNIYLGVNYGKSLLGFASTLKEFKPFFQAQSFVESSFYTDYDSETLLDSAIDGYVSGLDDKYSRYESPVEYDQSQLQDSGQSVGIGITIQATEDNYIEIMEVKDDTPAKSSGLQVGDIIKTIDGNDVAEYGFNESISLIKDGDDNTDINLTIDRDGESIDVTVTRTVMEVDTATGEMLDGDIGYIQITHFYTNTPDQFNAVYQELVEQGAKSFIFDLRNNTGGYTNSVQGCLNDLVPKGDVAEATYNDGSTSVIVKSTSDSEITVPSVVLTNGYTASAGEIFSSAMREFEGSILVGENTYGKGVMQVTHQLSNGGALVLTVATYNIVGRECYHGIGLAPDYEVALTEDDTTDTQLAKAIEVLSNGTD